MFTNAKNPRWSGTDHSSIILDVLFENETEYCPFVASRDDCTTHGPMLFNFAVNGIFGKVADSDSERILRGEISPPEGYQVINGEIVDVAAAEQEAQVELNRRLAELQTPEVLAQAELDEKFAHKRKEKLRVLLAVKEQSGWPFNIQWPL